MSIEVLPLGAGQDVGRSCCVVRMAGRTVMFDCGAHFGFRDARRFPEFGLLSRAGRFTEIIDALVITHFHTDHLGALPYFTEICGYRGPILMTYPTFAIAPIMLEDYVKVNADRPGERLPYNEQHVRDCLRRVTAVDLHQVVVVAPGLSFTFHYAGHVLGAAMVHMSAGHLTALYTGDFNTSPDRHLGPAEPLLPPAGPGGGEGGVARRPDVLISEATYAATLRDSKRARERDLLSAVVETVTAGGKVLIPTFAMGRAQELLMLITDCWERNGLQVPIYFSSAMASRALVYYQLLLNWTNANVRRTIFGAATPTAPARDGGAAAAAARRRCGVYRPYEYPSSSSGARGDVDADGGNGNLYNTGVWRAYDPGEEYDGGGSDKSDDDLDRESDDGDRDDPVGLDEYGRPGSRGDADGASDDGDGDGSGGGGLIRGGRRSRRRPLLPVDIVRQDEPRDGSATAVAAAAATSGGSGSISGSFAKGVGVFSEADVYGMFRTRPWDRSLLHAPGPALLFASPGNIASGVSLEAFRAWAGSPENLLVLAGYQVRGTLGARLEAIQNQAGAPKLSGGAATVEVPPGNGGGNGNGGGGGGGGGSSRVEVRCRIKMLAFSAHADLAGILGLVRRCRPRAVVLVHGQREPMGFLRGRIESTLGIECHAPPTGTTVTIAPRRDVPLGVRPQLVAAAKCAAAAALAMQGTAVAAAARATAAAAAAALHPRTAYGHHSVPDAVVGPGNISSDGIGDGDGRASAEPAAGAAAGAELGFGSSRGALDLRAAELRRLRPSPLTALPLSGVLVARVVTPVQQMQHPGPPPPLPPQAAGSTAGSQEPQQGLGADGSGAAANAATQLTLTDSGTAARALLQAHHASCQASVQEGGAAVTPYKITYGCTIVTQLGVPTVASGGSAPRLETHRVGGRAKAPVPVAANGAEPGENEPGDSTPDVADAAVAAASAALSRAYSAVSAAVGGYAASRRLRLHPESMILSFGSFRAQLSVTASRNGPSDLDLDEQSPAVAFFDTLAASDATQQQRQQQQQQQQQQAARGSAAAGRLAPPPPLGSPLQLRITCEWSALEDAVACRCLQALRRALGVGN